MSNEILNESNEILNNSNDKERLTIEELRTINGFKDISIQEADKLSDFISSIAEILYTYEF